MITPKLLSRLVNAMVIVLALGACARNHVAPDVETTIIRFARDSVPLDRTAEVTSFTVNVVIRNDGKTPIIVGGCGPEAQREINGEWQPVWSPICVSMQRSFIAPGDSLVGPVTVAGFTKLGTGPQLDPRMTTGTYRLRFGVSYSDTTNPTALNAFADLLSPPFVVFAP